MAASYRSSSGGGAGGGGGSSGGGSGGTDDAMGGWMPSAQDLLRAAKFRGIMRPLAADAIDAIQRQLLREHDRGVALDLILQELAAYLGRRESIACGGPGGSGGGGGAISEAIISDVIATMTRGDDDLRAVRAAPLVLCSW